MKPRIGNFLTFNFQDVEDLCVEENSYFYANTVEVIMLWISSYF